MQIKNRIRNIWAILSGTFFAMALALTAAPTQAAPVSLEAVGLISTRPQGSLYGVWTVGGIDYSTIDGVTVFDEDQGPLSVGACASVRYSVGAQSLLADRIVSKSASNCAVTATTTATPTATGTTTIETTLTGTPNGTATVEPTLTGTPNGTPTVEPTLTGTPNGTATVEPTQTGTPNGTATVEPTLTGTPNGTATVEPTQTGTPNGTATVEPTQTGTPMTFEAIGRLSARPISGTAGIWTIGGSDYVASDGQTIFITAQGPLVMGVCADVRYTLQSGLNVANRIRSKSADDCGPDDDASEDVETNGIVSSYPEGLIGNWVVDAVTYTANADTQFRQEDGPFAVGGCVEVKHILSTTLALRISTDDDCGVSALARAHGTLNAVPSGLIGDWLVDATTYRAVTSTVLDTRHGPFVVGACVEIKYAAADPLRTIVKAASEGFDDCGPAPFVTPTMRATGVISAMPDIGAFGAWTIGGQDYVAVTGTTRFSREDGALLIGGCAEVTWFEMAGQRIAREISSERPSDCAPETETRELFGAISALPDTTGLTGWWRVGGRPVSVTEATALVNPPFALGDFVEVKYTRVMSDLVATRIEKRRELEREHEMGQATGRLQARPAPPMTAGVWIIGNQPYSVTASTRLTGTLALSDCVSVRFSTAGDGLRFAAAIRTKSADDCVVGPHVEDQRAFGFVETMPSQSFFGTWVIGGAAYEVTARSRISESAISLAVGAYVKVEYRVVGGVIEVIELETAAPPLSGGTTLRGSLALPSGPLAPQVGGAQVWQVDGQSVAIVGATALDERFGLLQAGRQVVVNAFVDPITGARVATYLATAPANVLFIPRVMR